MVEPLMVILGPSWVAVPVLEELLGLTPVGALMPRSVVRVLPGRLTLEGTLVVRSVVLVLGRLT